MEVQRTGHQLPVPLAQQRHGVLPAHRAPPLAELQQGGLAAHALRPAEHQQGTGRHLDATAVAVIPAPQQRQGLKRLAEGRVRLLTHTLER